MRYVVGCIFMLDWRLVRAHYCLVFICVPGIWYVVRMHTQFPIGATNLRNSFPLKLKIPKTAVTINVATMVQEVIPNPGAPRGPTR